MVYYCSRLHLPRSKEVKLLEIINELVLYSFAKINTKPILLDIPLGQEVVQLKFLHERNVPDVIELINVRIELNRRPVIHLQSFRLRNEVMVTGLPSFEEIFRGFIHFLMQFKGVIPHKISTNETRLGSAQQRCVQNKGIILRAAIGRVLLISL